MGPRASSAVNSAQALTATNHFPLSKGPQNPSKASVKDDRATELPETNPPQEVPTAVGLVVVGCIFLFLGVLSSFFLMYLIGMGVLFVGLLLTVVWYIRKSMKEADAPEPAPEPDAEELP
jgi:hypothetical protein